MNKENKKEDMVEIEDYFIEGQLVKRKINGVEVFIPEMKKTFYQIRQQNFEKVKSLFGKYL